nr:hypothetical protein [Lachnospiraceae bacterium]
MDLCDDILDDNKCMYSTDNLRFVMDETSVPYEQNENPFPQTDLDDEFEKMIINKYHLTTK